MIAGLILVTLFRHFYNDGRYQKHAWSRSVTTSSGPALESHVAPNPGPLRVEDKAITDEPTHVQVKTANPKPLLVDESEAITDKPTQVQVKTGPLINRITPVHLRVNTRSLLAKKTAVSVPTWAKTNHSGSLNRSITATPTWVEVPNRIPFYVTSTYLDTRKNHFGRAVVALGYGKLSQPEQPIYCLFSDARWSQLQCTKEPLKKVKINDNFVESKNVYSEYYYVCKVSSLLEPAFVSFSSNSTCQQPSSWIPVTPGPTGPTKKFGVCIDSPLFDVNDPQYVIHIFEMNRILGAQWFTVYVRSVGAEVKKILKNYSDEGLVEFVDWVIPPQIRTRYHGQDLCLQDCAYRNMHRVKYLIYTDLDEIIVPQRQLVWSEMMEKLDQESRGAFIVRQVHLYGNITTGTCNASSKSEFEMPRFVTFTQRAVKIQAVGFRSKLIVKPKKFGRIGVHGIFEVLKGYQTYNVPPKVALLYHYRVPPAYTTRTMKEVRMVRYSSELLSRVQARIC